MRWMERLFTKLIAGQYPRLVDLPTGAGKTELVAIWLLALAWYGNNRANNRPVPRRLVWVVNRRVLVAQVYQIAKDLLAKLSAESQELREVRDSLSATSGGKEPLFDVIQLRGQIVANRDWAIRPTAPQLIIGTVDQIGSRLLFQGYGLGKWGRPQQAGLLGVDSWVAVDEAHLVPAFVLTMRQLHRRCPAATDNLPTSLRQAFSRLPFWTTELSATPGLPEPEASEPSDVERLKVLSDAANDRQLRLDEQAERDEFRGIFRLTEDERKDERIADRIRAAETKRVKLVDLGRAEKPKKILEAKLAEAAVAFGSNNHCARVAVFVREVGVANSVANKIGSALTKVGIDPNRQICKITGRLRGYERERLAGQNAFKCFLPPDPNDPSNPMTGTVYLIGTAAAEVGLDADADVIFCDFVALPTLLQRLGRLDRRGEKTRRYYEQGGEPPTMTIFAFREKETKASLDAQTRIGALAKALAADSREFSAELMAGARWAMATAKRSARDAGKPSGSEPTEGDDEGATFNVDRLVDAATWKLLAPVDSNCVQPATWKGNTARVAAGAVAVPPLTDAVLDHWCATTQPRSRYLTPHPFLYGLLEDPEGTPLVGVAFRLELEALFAEPTSDEEKDVEEPGTAAEIIEIFENFPPQRAELHQVPLSLVRDWLASARRIAGG